MDAFINAAFLNIRRLRKFFIIIPHSDAIVECMLSKIGLVTTKKNCSLQGESLDILMGFFSDDILQSSWKFW